MRYAKLIRLTFLGVVGILAATVLVTLVLHYAKSLGVEIPPSISVGLLFAAIALAFAAAARACIAEAKRLRSAERPRS